MATSRIGKLGQVVRLKCPNCGKTNVFHKTKYPFVSTPKMKESCENCGYLFYREPGYFKGVVFFSYGFAVLEGLLAYALAKFLIYGVSTTNLILITIASILFLAMWNYKFARVLWMNLFPG